ncbi:uncharacterized protein LOC130725533 [Lotus japonicus]|uniref:uncharacterized protein LOC130725533 n=1 Tax=Lotus japonicus TaxID=34305 RepID=UPI0025830E4E|nr:uncharacterized protein LOC130725533 [Lotus japonicus]
MPTCDEVAALIVGDFNSEKVGRDIIVKTSDGMLQRIHETHTAFIPLQYPLMFPYGDDGYHEDIPYSEEYLTNEDITRLRQFVVDTYTMIESQRLSFIRRNQNLIRADFLNELEEAIDRGETDPTTVGMRVILPSSFMAWSEIKRYVRQRNLRADERPDICCRVFKMKLEQMMADFKQGAVFGGIQAGMYTIEFQKRGLPHAHILLWLKDGHKMVTCADIDKHISAELPDPALFPKLSKAVSRYMMHGPCGLLMRYRGHINVEYCNKSNSIKYLFKYVSKGPDRVSVHITNENSGDSSSQRILFRDDEDLEAVISKPSSQLTMFLAWMRANQQFEDAKNLTFADDREYIDAIVEASDLGSGNQLRKLFVFLITSNTMNKPELVWEKTWKILSDGIVHSKRNLLGIPDLRIDDNDLKNLCLIEIEKLMHVNGRSLKEFTCLPFPEACEGLQFDNKFIVDELNYDKNEMEMLHQNLLRSLTYEQKNIIWNTLSAAFKAKGLIILNVASSGIASLLLPDGRTAHSRFSIPISINECSTCNIKQGSQKAELLQKTSLIIWDEAPMLNKYCFEALDRTLNDVMRQEMGSADYVPFGGKVVVLGGDFRQILPVVSKGSRSDIVGSAINASYLWKYCTVLKLTKNMRLLNCPSTSDVEDIKNFAEWIL